jgi:hypothetical protein
MTQTTRISCENVIDADGHINNPPDLWETYLEPQYRDRASCIRTGSRGWDHVGLDSRCSKFFHSEILAYGYGRGKTFDEQTRPSMLGENGARV